MPAWHDRLKQYEREGFREIEGPESNDRILKWAHGAGGAKWVKSDATPWCGIGMAGIFDECGLGHVIPREPAKAISWKELGEECSPRRGAIVVFPRQGGHHVTCIDRIEGDTWHCIGCNQHDAICTIPFKGREALAVRWPLPLKSESDMAEESRIARAAARQQADMAKAGSTGSPPAVVPDVPMPKGMMQTAEGMLGQAGRFRSLAETGLDFLTFAGGQWRLILAAVAIFYLARVLYDGRRIQAWRTQDHNEGWTQ